MCSAEPSPRRLGYLHKLGIAYCDLRPENLLVDGDGNVHLTVTPHNHPVLLSRRRPLIGCRTHDDFPLCSERAVWWRQDFGLSKVQTADRLRAGSPAYYAAPELLAAAAGKLGSSSGGGGGGGALDVQAPDWWSLGVLCFELLSGRPPFHSTHPDRLRAQITSGSVELPSSVTGDTATSAAAPSSSLPPRCAQGGGLIPDSSGAAGCVCVCVCSVVQVRPVASCSGCCTATGPGGSGPRARPK